MTELQTTAAEFLTQEVRAQFAAFADRVVPAVGDKPSATDVGVHDRWIDVALAARPDLVAPLATVLRQLQADPGSALTDVDADLLESVVELIIACYFMSPLARHRINYQGQVPRRIAEGETEYYLEEDDVLAPVLSRGPLWRRTPDDPG